MKSVLKIWLPFVLVVMTVTFLRAEQPTTTEDAKQTEEISVVVKPEVKLVDGSPSIKAKFGSGLKITTANDSYSIQIRGRFQSLFAVEHMYDSDDSPLVGFQVRRARLKLAGHVGKGKEDPEDKIAGKHQLKYSVQLGFTNKDISGIADGKGPLLDAYIDYSPTDHLTFRFGQAKLPGNREGVTSSQKQEFVDRSIGSAYKLDRDIGLQMRGKFGEKDKFMFKPYMSVALGEGRNQTTLNVGGLDYTFRGDLLPLGEFKGKGDYTMADVDRQPEPKLAFGAAYDFNHNAGLSRGQRGGNRIDSDSLTSIHTLFTDMLFKYKGFSIFSEYSRRTVDEDFRKDNVMAGQRFYATGNALVAQMGYVCKKNFEFAARYARTMPLGNIDLDKDMKSGLNAYTLGLSQYFLKHNLKIQTDYTIYDVVNAGDTYGVWRFQVEVAF